MNHHPTFLSPTWLVAACLAVGPAVASDAGHEAKPQAAKAPAAAKVLPPTAPPAPATDTLDRLRERLAEKLGAARPPDSPSPNLLRVVSKAGGAAAHDEAPAPRRPAAAAATPAATAAAPRRDAAPAAVGGHGSAAVPHWSYSGELGPQAWGGLQPGFALCAEGKRQSPIDIRDGFGVELEPVTFDYRASGFRVIDNGHTVQVNVDGGNSVLINGRRHELLQFHFHRPSEERIEGRQFDMVVHLVHKDADGRLAVVAVLLERGSAQPLVQTVWNHLPLEKHEEFAGRVTIDLSQLLPADRRYYTYMGSLTTPPCSEGVLWVVLRQPVAISPEQIGIFSRLYPMNARPVQAAAGRIIKQSN